MLNILIATTIFILIIALIVIGLMLNSAQAYASFLKTIDDFIRDSQNKKKRP